MDKKEFIAALEELGWPKNEYVILSGGSLLLRGLRETTADIDVSLSKHLAEEINLYDAPQDEKGYYNPRENVQAFDDSDKKEFDIVDGYQCETLESILAFKKKMMRPKDLKDIEKIEAALKGTA
ncbi:MAG: hypothetical protein Q4F56_00925 [Candidatus Saccharibacteria bacterium]|nr:hypothetical protein [Candidatus Saccharibacteria bacterium]